MNLSTLKAMSNQPAFNAKMLIYLPWALHFLVPKSFVQASFVLHLQTRFFWSFEALLKSVGNPFHDIFAQRYSPHHIFTSLHPFIYRTSIRIPSHDIRRLEASVKIYSFSPKSNKLPERRKKTKEERWLPPRTNKPESRGGSTVKNTNLGFVSCDWLVCSLGGKWSKGCVLLMIEVAKVMKENSKKVSRREKV